METTQPAAPSERTTARRAATAQLAVQRKNKKLHAIAQRRADARGMTKEDYIAEIVKGNYPPITAIDIAAEPVPQSE